MIGFCILQIYCPFAAMTAEPFSQHESFVAAPLFFIACHVAHYSHSKYGLQDRQAFHFEAERLGISLEIFKKN